MSSDESSSLPRRFVLMVDETRKRLLEREDTDGNFQITIDDDGPKTISLGTIGSGGYKSFSINGTYALSSLLMELTLAQDYGQKTIVLDHKRLFENPMHKLSRLIRDSFWNNLTRRIDASNIEKAGKDPKDWTDDPRPRIYVPRAAPEQHEYYTQVAKSRPEIRLDVQWLPDEPITPEYVRDLNEKPGLLALEMETIIDETTGEKKMKGLPFVVPGGRFNELYGWDSYMESIGLLINGRVDLCEAMVRNFCFCIKHYGKVLNANRSYYLMRSQPPFLTDFTLNVFERKNKDDPASLEFLRLGILAAIKEYYSVWMSEPRYDPASGLSRYRPGGSGVPPETEASHFVHIITPYAEKMGLTFEQYVQGYNDGSIKEPELDEYFLHDRAVRESGHDTSYRLEGVAANLATVDLNSCLYKYETDIANCIRKYFKERISVPPEFQTAENRVDAVEISAVWDRRAKRRKQAMDRYLWNPNKNMYFDYDTVRRKRTTYECATTFWPMWAGAASPTQAASLVLHALPKFEAYGGILSGTEKSRGQISLSRPNRQWDYPFGWAPQQILAWGGLIKYGYDDVAEALAYKWVFMVLKAFVDFNGVVVEKYNVTRELDPHKVEAEYGNQGSDFVGVPREGFGWVNSSYVYGLSILKDHAKRAIGALTPYETFKKATAVNNDDFEDALEDITSDDDYIIDGED
ncbi:putative neutral trehalase [Phaeomoniella chlamydospora]|uniref:Trehalase n=1 Tax=Phaeomoniella chlamydospora TaxID=158046 RepID=A0A0G2E5Z3_PHACM|nr:putative neutral trehalase [Phaeomoniella chlamydospora]